MTSNVLNIQSRNILIISGLDYLPVHLHIPPVAPIQATLPSIIFYRSLRYYQPFCIGATWPYKRRWFRLTYSSGLTSVTITILLVLMLFTKNCISYLVSTMVKPIPVLFVRSMIVKEFVLRVCSYMFLSWTSSSIVPYHNVVTSISWIFLVPNSQDGYITNAPRYYPGVWTVSIAGWCLFERVCTFSPTFWMVWDQILSFQILSIICKLIPFRAWPSVTIILFELRCSIGLHLRLQQMNTKRRPRRSTPHRTGGWSESRASTNTHNRSELASTHHNAFSHQSSRRPNRPLTNGYHHNRPINNSYFALGNEPLPPTIPNFSGNHQKPTHIQPYPNAYPQHILQHMPFSSWPSPHPSYPPHTEPFLGHPLYPHPSILVFPDQGNSQPAATMSYAGTSSQSTNQSLDVIRWQMQYGKHKLEFCPKCRLDLIHHFGSFSTQFNGRWHTREDCAEQLRLNGRFRERLRTNREAREEINKAHASALSRALPVGATTAGQGRQEADMLEETTPRQVIVQLPPSDTRLRPSLTPLDESQGSKAQQPRQPNNDNPGPTADLTDNHTPIPTNGHN